MESLNIILVSPKYTNTFDACVYTLANTPIIALSEQKAPMISRGFLFALLLSLYLPG